MPITFAYYCSGHGYGHATRVSAFASYLLRLDPPVIVHIVSSAPQSVFSQAIVLGAVYRHAEIDPVIVQPLAYRVDRQASIQVLKKFLEKKDGKLKLETEWLQRVNADCVLSDAAFLGCLAAKSVNIPSVLITNFTFDSVYSYLSTQFVDRASPSLFDSLLPDTPISEDIIAPLVAQIHAGYCCASLLLQLPGNIPIPSFRATPSLPSPDWVDITSNTFYPSVAASLIKTSTCDQLILDSTRQVISAPLLVREPSSNIYTAAGRSTLLASIGIPRHLHSANDTKILIVSFGGQVFRLPKSNPGSRSHSRQGSRSQTPTLPIAPSLCKPHLFDCTLKAPDTAAPKLTTTSSPSPRLATSSHIWIPGAPPLSKPQFSTSSSSGFSSFIIPPTPIVENSDFYTEQLDDEPQLLPDSSWICVVCGVSEEQRQNSNDEDLPENFFIAPGNIYMPDLLAVGDVLLGKLGYGTTAECVDSCTPFIFVSRPLFIEEHGLRHLLSQQGVGVELARQDYEQGDWANSIEEAWLRGRAAKTQKRQIETERARSGDVRPSLRNIQGREMAQSLVGWVVGQSKIRRARFYTDTKYSREQLDF